MEFQKLYTVSYSNSRDNLHVFPLKKWDKNVTAGCTGPNAGITRLDLHSMELDTSQKIAGVKEWNVPNDTCYGVSATLYEEDATTDPARFVGDPNADVYGAVVRGNNTVLAIADGCGWGKRPRLAARCAVRTAIEHTLANTDKFNKKPSSKTLLSILMTAMEASHKTIIQHKATLTTLCISVVCQLDIKGGSYGVFTASLGDSRAFVYCPSNRTLMEASIGSHSSDGIRSIRDSGGALGPAIGALPDMENLSFSCIPVAKGDIVILTTDGITDNISQKNIEHIEETANPHHLLTDLASRTVPHSDHMTNNEHIVHPCCEASSALNRVISRHQQSLDWSMSPYTIALFLINMVMEITEDKRQFRTECVKKDIDVRTRELQDPEFAERKKKQVGKLDHATILTYLIK